MYKKINLFLSLLLVFFFANAQVVPDCKVNAPTGLHQFKYTNPMTRDTSISMRDHFIIKVGNKWYCTGTSAPVWTGRNPGVRLLESDDLIHWKQYSWLIDASKLPPDCPYNGRFWAPETLYKKQILSNRKQRKGDRSRPKRNEDAQHLAVFVR